MEQISSTIRQLLLFPPEENSIYARTLEALDAGDAAASVRLLLSEAVRLGLQGDLWKLWLTGLLAESEGPWSRLAERRPAPDGTLKALALQDLAGIRELWTSEPQEPLWQPLRDFRCDALETTEAGARLAELEASLDTASSPESMLDALAAFTRKYGCGSLALATVFRPDPEGRPVPLEKRRPVFLRDLVGYESQKAELRDNTEAFLRGQGANNVLLYGDAGTGKSTSIQALAAEYGSRGLRMIELYRGQYHLIPGLMARLKDRNYRFILVLDDLSFEESETEYKFLKAVLEGGAEAAPENVRIYATSNRRHLIRENWSDRDDMEHCGDIHRSDTVEEKLSLAGRFGLQIFYPAPSFEEYHRIVAELAAREEGTLPEPESLRAQASTWQVRRGSRSGRTARQFLDSLHRQTPE